MILQTPVPAETVRWLAPSASVVHVQAVLLKMNVSQHPAPLEGSVTLIAQMGKGG